MRLCRGQRMVHKGGGWLTEDDVADGTNREEDKVEQDSGAHPVGHEADRDRENTRPYVDGD